MIHYKILLIEHSQIVLFVLKKMLHSRGIITNIGTTHNIIKLYYNIMCIRYNVYFTMYFRTCFITSISYSDRCLCIIIILHNTPNMSF